MSAIPATDVESLGALVDRLAQEHRVFASEIERIGSISALEDMAELHQHFVSLQDGLTGHMLTEEFEVNPELVRRGIFDEEMSKIMRQHHDVTAALSKMELALRLRNLAEFRIALEELSRVLEVHHPAEEEKICRPIRPWTPRDSRQTKELTISFGPKASPYVWCEACLLSGLEERRFSLPLRGVSLVRLRISAFPSARPVLGALIVSDVCT